MRKVFADTNILLDYLMFRLPGGPMAEQLFQQAVEGRCELYIAAHSVNNMFYILRKHYSDDVRKELLKNICALCKLVSIDEEMIGRALSDERSGDMEDALQLLCAEKCGAEIFVTRDTELKDLLEELNGNK